MRKTVISLLVAAPLSTAAVANPVDNYGASAIQAANYTAAEADLTSHLRRAPSDQPALINLAYVYRQTARMREANALYNRVLNRADVRLRTTEGAPIWSHEAARRGLSGTVSIAMR